MPTTPNENDLIAAALERLFRDTSPSPKVRASLIELGADEVGDAAVFVTVLLDDATSDNDWVSAKLDPIAEAVRGAVRDTGVKRWPYVRFARLSDAGGPGADAPQWKAAS